MNLTIKNLTKSYGDKMLFNDFNYEFKESGLYIITGDSGAGKTTLLRIISGLERFFDGQIINGGFKNTSYSFQEYRLFPQLTLLENLTEIFENKSETLLSKAIEILTALGFSEADFNLLPNELSGGMKQRASLARALMKDAPILLLDEPTKELDEALRERVVSLIESEAKNRLVIMVTHNENEVFALNPVKIDLNRQ